MHESIRQWIYYNIRNYTRFDWICKCGKLKCSKCNILNTPQQIEERTPRTITAIHFHSICHCVFVSLSPKLKQIDNRVKWEHKCYRIKMRKIWTNFVRILAQMNCLSFHFVLLLRCFVVKIFTRMVLSWHINAHRKYHNNNKYNYWNCVVFLSQCLDVVIFRYAFNWKKKGNK